MLRLVIRTSQGETRFQSGLGEILVGRREGVDLRLTDPSVALTHCLLRPDGDRLILVDLGGESGTYVGGKKVRRARLAPGATIRVGATTLRLIACGPAAAASVAADAATPVPNRDAGPDFGREIRAMLAKAPWYALSLVAHAVALLLLHTVAFQQTETTIYVALESSRSEIPPEPEQESEEPDIHMDDIVPDDELLLEMERELEEAPSAKATHPAAGEQSDEFATPVTGLNQSTPTLKRLTKALPRKEILTGAAENINKGSLTSEHAGAARVVRAQLGQRGIPTGFSKSQIVVVEGEFDSMELVLREYKIAFTPTTRERLLRKNYPAAKLLCINCGHQPSVAHRAKLVAKIKSFVRRGGWVITTDWALDPYLTMAWPHIVKSVRPTRHQPNTTVQVTPTGQSPLLEGVFSHRTQTRWWLEEASKFVKLSGTRARVLISSSEMDRRYGSSIVAFDFKDRGRVVHLMGHFYQMDGNRAGLVGMHRLIINLIRERFAKNRQD